MSAPAPAGMHGQAVPNTGPEAPDAAMRARVGDEIVVRGTAVGLTARDGEIVPAPHPAGAPAHASSVTDEPMAGGRRVAAR